MVASAGLVALVATLVATSTTTHALRLHWSDSLRADRHARPRPRLLAVPVAPRLHSTSRLAVADGDRDGEVGGEVSGEAAVVDKMREERLALLRGWGLEKRCV